MHGLCFLNKYGALRIRAWTVPEGTPMYQYHSAACRTALHCRSTLLAIQMGYKKKKKKKKIALT